MANRQLTGTVFPWYSHKKTPQDTVEQEGFEALNDMGSNPDCHT